MPTKTRRIKKSSRTGTIDDDALAMAVARVMQNPAFNVDWMPDLIEYYAHKHVATALLEALKNMPVITLYGHEISLVVTPSNNSL